MQGDYERAAALLSSYLGQDSNKEEAWRYMAEIYEKQGHWLKAAYHWKRLMQLNVLNEEYERRCVEANYRMHNYIELRKIWKRKTTESA